MNPDPMPTDHPTAARSAGAPGGTGLRLDVLADGTADCMADFLAGIGYEAADPCLQGLPWHEVAHRTRNKRAL
jgi:hypothetical protein